MIVKISAGAALASLTLSGCCDVSGCEAADGGPVAAAGIKEGLAGAGATFEDICGADESCCECPKADFVLTLIASEGLLADDASAQALFDSDAEREHVTMVNGYFYAALSPGNYLVCVQDDGGDHTCRVAGVRPDEVTTTNVISGVGSLLLNVLNEDGTPQSGPDFNVSDPAMTP